MGERRKAQGYRRAAFELIDRMQASIEHLRDCPPDQLGELIRLFKLEIHEAFIVGYYLPGDAHAARVEFAALNEELDGLVKAFEAEFAYASMRVDNEFCSDRQALTEPSLQRLQRFRTMI